MKNHLMIKIMKSLRAWGEVQMLLNVAIFSVAESITVLTVLSGKIILYISDERYIFIIS